MREGRLTWACLKQELVPGQLLESSPGQLLVLREKAWALALRE